MTQHASEGTSEVQAAAAAYIERGFSVIPIKPGSKEPLVRWTEFQDRKATPEEVACWFQQWPGAGIGIVTGKISGIVVVDVDQKPGVEDSLAKISLPPTYTVRSGGGGSHHYYRFPNGQPVPNRKGYLPAIDIQGDRAYVVAPPSIHPSGKAYAAENGLECLADAPVWLLGIESDKRAATPESPFEGVTEGLRNDAAARIAGALLRKLPPESWDTLGWAELLRWNESNTPPLPQGELTVVFESIKLREEAHRIEDSDQIVHDNAPAISLKDLCAKNYPATKWAAEPLFESGTLNMISAPPGQFKSWIALHLALCLANGQPMFGHFKTDRQPVLIINEDDPARLLQERVNLLGADHNEQVYFRVERGFKLDDKSTTVILDEMRDKEIRFLIFDTFRSVHLADENSASDMQKIMDRLKRFTRAGHTVLLIHHNRKKQGTGSASDGQGGEEARGSTAIIGALHGHITCRVSNDEGQDILVINQAKIKGAEGKPPFKVSINRTLGDGNKPKMSFNYAGEYRQEDQATKKAVEVILKALMETGLWLGVKDCVELEAGRTKTVRLALKSLVKEGKIEEKTRAELSGARLRTPTGKGNQKLYAIKPKDSDR